ncbi:MAG: hypothetical protein ACI4MI_05545 [Christensenellales bacterium]
MSKNGKTIKTVILVIVTLVVVAAVFLTVYFVEKNDKSRWDKSYIGSINQSDGLQWSVESVDFEGTLEGMSAADGKIWAVIKVSLTAKSDKTVKPSDFELEGVAPYTDAENYFAEKIKLKKGETHELLIAFEVTESVNELRLYCYGYAVAIGGSLQGEEIK